MRPSKSPLKRDFPSWQVADVIDYGLLKENAKANRNNLTEAESVFWNIAKSGGLGQKCRRQYIIGQYIVDFFFRQFLKIALQVICEFLLERFLLSFD